MTPFAAQMFRQGDRAMQETLARCQFFECTALFPMAREMVEAEREYPSATYSEMAHLPAPETVIEFHSGTGRIVMLSQQAGSEIRFSVWIPGHDRSPIERARTGFVLGTDRNLETQWSVFPGEPAAPGGQLLDGDRRTLILRSFHLVLEKFLCIINQPGLVGQTHHDTDRRVQRLARSAGLAGVPLKWHECNIRPGVHGASVAGEVAEDAAQRQLHYVRKHFKPSLDRWIDGYWRGNRDLGIHLKWYSAKGTAS